ncbi:carbohydrate ABC transporter permease [Mycolicibacterium helvum]|uniref:ABC transporter permease n=1 Tax=Mycolicibacterium helvum TaxID=1534349 RepID=A0A7I7TBE4_9MYCO|nr:carbohydrate ABC transporter permease [Mycolicibacterium helvum]BBY66564.1 ABC transporter permease [Mycolicibacterium helvum]
MLSRVASLGKWTFLGMAVLLTLFPLYWTFCIATQDPVATFGEPRFIFTPRFSAFETVWNDQGFIQALGMSALTVGITLVITMVVVIPAAFILTRREVRARTGLLAWLFVAYLFPDFLVAIPLYSVLQSIGLYDTALGLALAYQTAAVPLAMWLMLAFFRALPPELSEAATLDGCSTWRTLRYVSLPLVIPGIATTAIILAVNMWNEVTIALALTSANPTIPILASRYKGYASVHWDQLAAAALLTSAPVLLFAVFVQRYIVRGLTAGIER